MERDKKRIGLVGLGLMGKPMGLNWLKKGFQLNIFPHIHKSASEELEKNGAVIKMSYSELASSSDVIVLMLPTSKEVESVCLGKNSLIEFVTPSHFVIDMGTSDPQSTRKISKFFEARSVPFFDSPVTGGVKGAMDGTLTLFLGGSKEHHKKCEDVLAAVSQIRESFGDVGQGHVAKIINNFVCIGNLAVFSEALPLAVKWGLDANGIFKTLLQGTANSKMLELYGSQILSGDFAPRFKLAHAFKDLHLAESLISELKEGVDLPVFKGILKEFERSMKEGLGEENISSLIKPIENLLQTSFRTQK